jgi:arylsulfatase
VVHWPRGIAAKNELRRDPGHLIDLVPTVMDVAGGKLPTEWKGEAVPPKPGKSLAAAFARNGALGERNLWWLHEENRAMRIGDWKLVSEKRRGKWELYDLSKDRGETNDLSDKHPDKVRELTEAWQRQLDDARRLAGNE